MEVYSNDRHKRTAKRVISRAKKDTSTAKSVDVETPKSKSSIELSDKELVEAIAEQCKHSFNLLIEFCKRNGVKAEDFIKGKIQELKERK